MKQLNYAALEEIQPKVSWHGMTTQGSYTDAQVTLIFMGLIFFISAALAMVRSEFSAAVLYLMVVSGSIVAVYRSARRRAQQNERLVRFAAQNNLELLYGRKEPAYSGIFFKEGHSTEIEAALRIPELGEIGNYSYVTSSGKNRTTHSIGYIRLTLSRRVPHMLLDAKHNNVFGISNLPVLLEKNQKLELEGDFYKYFTLYTPKGYERDALYIWTPDVMSSVLDGAATWDIECIDNEVYLYSSRKFELTNAPILQNILKRAEHILRQIEEQADYYKDDAIVSRAANVIAPAGTRLKSKRPWIVIAFAAAVVLLQFMPTAIAPLTTDENGVATGVYVLILASAVLPTVLLVAVFLWIRRK